MNRHISTRRTDVFQHYFTMTSQLIALSQLISQSVAQIDQVCKDNNLVFPHLDEPYTSSTEEYRTNQTAADAANVIAAAALQLAATVLPTAESVSNIIFASFKSASLRVCLEAFVPEILREAGPKGLHVDEIAAKNNIDSMKLGRMLRFLATHHIFREVTPDVFANNKVSGMLDTGKAVKDLIADPESKHDNTPGIVALSEWFLDEGHKASAFAWEAMKDPATAFSGEVDETPFNYAYKEKLPLWTWYEKAENSYRLRRFGLAMRGASMIKPSDSISLSVVDWKSFPQNSLVVDVGGGVGGTCLPLAKAYPHLNFVIQDRQAVIEKGTTVWQANMPDALESGRVKFQAHDFFAEQPINNASVFLLRHIMHDWSDPYAAKILSSLRAAATPGTKLLLIDSIIAHACDDPNSNTILGAAPREAPQPLLPNYGAANGTSYGLDIAMLCFFNSQERTIAHLDKLLKSTGWRINKVHRLDGTTTYLHPVEAVPII